MKKPRILIPVLLSFLPAILLSIGGSALPQSRQPANSLLDLSGLAWIDGNRFLAVHDSKNPEEKDRPRVSFVYLPESPIGVTWQPLTVDWASPLGVSNDLESIARIPATNQFLLVESGEGVYQNQRCRRIFISELQNEVVKISAIAELHDSIRNIEGTTVMRFGERLLFIIAERADHEAYATIQVASLQLNPFKLGPITTKRFQPAGYSGRNWRPVSSIESDSRGYVYFASAYDPEDDNGPFRSIIWRVGPLTLDRLGRPGVPPGSKPKPLAVLDGFKVESLAIREQQGKIELFAGTDDENYGAVLRPIILPDGK